MSLEPDILAIKENKPDVQKRGWKEFQDSGLLWWINRTLHLFGWAIVFEVDNKSGEVLDVYPARTIFRGFPANDERDGFRAVAKYLSENAIALESESNLKKKEYVE